MNIQIKHSALVMLCISALSMSVLTTADVLDLDEVSSADANTLSQDTKVFDTIGMGIALSIAQCEGRENCEPSVDEAEVQQLIEALDKRIEGVVSRQQESEEDLGNIITAYVDTKERYTDYMDRLGKITKSPEPELPQDEFAEEDVFADDGAMTEDEFSAFEDFDETLKDDATIFQDDDSALQDDEFDPENQ